MRYLYTFLFYLALPFVFLRVLWKSRRQPDYRKRWRERFGFYPYCLEKCLWVHAVSVGEVIAALPMIKALKEQYPTIPMLVTTMTPTGAARVQSALGDSVHHAFIPYDLPAAAARFLVAMKPIAGIIMETELWPNLFSACQDKGIPICVLNARLSKRSARGYQRVAALTREMLRRIELIAANSQADAKRFIALGADSERVVVTGNIKFDLEIAENLATESKALRQRLGEDRFIWVASSTHPGEEELMLIAHEKIRQVNPQALLVLVPRHPDRFNDVAKLISQKFILQRRSSQQPNVAAETAVFLADSMGEMLLFYGACDVAYVGGSLVPHGGHNIVEPAALGKPVLIGPHMRNFYEVSKLFLAANALRKVENLDEFINELIVLMQNPAVGKGMGELAQKVVVANRGVLAKQLALVQGLVKLR